MLAQSGARWMFLFEGVNDIGGSPPTPAGQKAVIDELLAAYDQIILRAHARGMCVYGATLTPFGGNGYDDRRVPRGGPAGRERVDTYQRPV